MINKEYKKKVKDKIAVSDLTGKKELKFFAQNCASKCSQSSCFYL